MKTTITTQKQIRAAFWAMWTESHGNSAKQSLRQNRQPADIRMAFCDFVESLSRSGQISEALVNRATL